MLDEAFASKSRPRLSVVGDKPSSVIVQPWSQLAHETADVTIREARTRDEKQQLYRFRYQLRSTQSDHSADHDGNRLLDDLDDNGVNLIALCKSVIVGAIRINYAWRSALGVRADFYRMREFAGSDHPAHSCIISRLVVDPVLRGRRFGYRLCAAAYKHALERDARIGFLNCEDHLIYYFSVLGFKAYMGRTRHEEYGEVVPMKLDLLDEKFLMMVNSPLLPELRSWKQSKQPRVAIRPLQGR